MNLKPLNHLSEITYYTFINVVSTHLPFCVCDLFIKVRAHVLVPANQLRREYE